MSLYNMGIPYGAMNPDVQRKAEAEKAKVETERANREKGKNAVADYNKQYPGAFSVLVNPMMAAGQAAEEASKATQDPTQDVKGKLEYAMQYEQNTPGQVNPDSTADPAKAIAVNTQNRQEGYSNGVKKPPEAPTMPEIELAMEEQKTKQVTFDTNQIPNWYESNSFWNGLMAAGISLMDGGTLGQAFNAGGKIFQEGFAKEKRQMWAQDLLDQGFDQHEVQAWIETGDQKVLTDPMQKKMQEQAYQLGQYQLQEAAYKGSKEYKAYEREMRNWENELKVDEINERREHRAWERQHAETKLGLEKIKMDLQASKAASLTPRDYSQLASTVMPTIKVANQRIAFSDAAQRDLNDIKRYMAEGNAEGVQGSYKSFQYNMARAVKGGGATLTEKDVEGASALTSWGDDWANKTSLKVTGSPSKFWVQAMEKSVTNDIQNQTEGVRQIAEEVYNTYAPQFGHEEAQKIVRRIVGGGSVGNVQFDPETGVTVESGKFNPASVKIQR